MNTPAPSRTNAWIHCVSPRPSARMRLFCLPYAGGGASIFRGWDRDLPPDVELCPVQLPGREYRLRETPFTNVDTLVQVLIRVLYPYLDKPFALFGHSMGALIGHALIQQLQSQLKTTPALFFAAGRRAPHRSETVNPPLHSLSRDEFLLALRHRYQGIPEVLLQDKEFMYALEPMLRADFTMIETYGPKLEPRLECPVITLGGTDDPHTDMPTLQAWRETTNKEFQLCMIAAGHFFLNEKRQETLAIIGRHLAPIIASTETAS